MRWLRRLLSDCGFKQRMKKSDRKKKAPPLPKKFKPLFWDVDFGSLSWQKHRDYIIGRILERGDWSAIEFVRRKTTDEGIKDWILRREGRGLDNRQLRFWQVVLELDNRTVNAWLARNKTNPWFNRLN
jgi:hypothetical protein